MVIHPFSDSHMIFNTFLEATGISRQDYIACIINIKYTYLILIHVFIYIIYNLFIYVYPMRYLNGIH